MKSVVFSVMKLLMIFVTDYTPTNPLTQILSVR